ncbi:MAG: hypothetical protein ABIS45_17230 [Burkholderiales bacterium]
MPADLNLSNLRPWLDEQEAYARSIQSNDARMDIARQMLAVIAEARSDLAPSADSTANYVPNKQIIEDLSVLRDQAEHMARSGSK